jgi:hypothetical protein
MSGGQAREVLDDDDVEGARRVQGRREELLVARPVLHAEPGERGVLRSSRRPPYAEKSNVEPTWAVMPIGHIVR